jgi:predicted AAA+ superfamily ATPase
MRLPTPLPRLSESLAGRMEILSLYPFSQGEIDGIKEALFEKRLPHFSQSKKDNISIIDRIIAGGYPEAVSRTVPSRRRAWFDSYITTILLRDVRDITDTDGLSNMTRLLSLIAVRSPSLLNFAEFSRTIAIPQTTLKRYMMLLEATFLIRSLPAWSGHLGKRLVKASKLILCDTGLMAHLLGANKERIISAGLIGPLLENFVIMEMEKQITWSEIRPKIFHFRTQAGQEVDIVLEDSSGRIVGIEVKASATVGGKDFNGLKTLAEITGKNFIRGIILYTGDNIIPFGNNLHVLPVSSIWGKNSV